MSMISLTNINIHMNIDRPMKVHITMHIYTSACTGKCASTGLGIDTMHIYRSLHIQSEHSQEDIHGHWH